MANQFEEHGRRCACTARERARWTGIALGALMLLAARPGLGESTAWSTPATGVLVLAQAQTQSADQLFETTPQDPAPESSQGGGSAADSLFESDPPTAAPESSQSGATSADSLFESAPPAAAPASSQSGATSADSLFESDPPAAAPASSQSGATSADSLFESDPPAAAPASSQSGATSADSLFESDPPAAAPAGSADSLFATESSESTPPEAPSKYSVTGFFQNELAYIYASPGHWSKFKNTLELTADGSFDNGIGWRLGGRLSYDPIYDITNFYPNAVRDDQAAEAQIREAYIDMSAGDLELRFGRQHLIWGEVVGGFVADVVDAKDLRESTVQDFDMLRIAQWAATAEYFKDDFYGQLVWIPFTTVNNIGKPGADFFPYPVPPQPPVPGATAVFLRDKTPSPALSNSGVGARMSYLTAGWDTSLFYYTSRDQQAAFRREILSGAQPVLRYTPLHERIHQFGTTVTKDIGDALFKLEAVYTVDRLFEVTSLADADGLVRKNELNYLVGLEWAFEHDTQLNVQFSQRWFPDHVSSMVPDELESGFSVYLSTKALHPDVKPELLWIQSLNRGSDWQLQAKVNWEFHQNWRAVVGADIWNGPPTGLFGRFDSNDRVYSELRYTF